MALLAELPALLDKTLGFARRSAAEVIPYLLQAIYFLPMRMVGKAPLEWSKILVPAAYPIGRPVTRYQLSAALEQRLGAERPEGPYDNADAHRQKDDEHPA